MAAPRRSQDVDAVQTTTQSDDLAPAANQHAREKDADVERVFSVDTNEPSAKEHMNYDRVDAELAKYANAVAVDISPEENARLKKLIDRRVLPIMIFTYFLQALDKGTMSFTGIMGIREDIPVLQDNSKVCTFPLLPG
jgi:hypothetical protein